MANWTSVEGILADGLPMRLYIAESEGRVCQATLHDDEHVRTEDEFLWRLGRATDWKHCNAGTGPETLSIAVAEVREYFAGKRLSFDVPLEFHGTPFQVRVWQALTHIPFGATCSYAHIAESIGQPGAPRAVGGANGRNRIPVFVPCHRVIAAGGKLGGFTGGLGLKKRLLTHEAAVLMSKRQKASAAAQVSASR